MSGDEVVAEPASILRRINPGMVEGVESPPIDLETAWEKAVASIVEEHNAELRAGASESVGPLQQWALEVVADPTVTLPPGAGDAYDALQVGRSQPVRRALGEVKRRADHGRGRGRSMLDGGAASVSRKRSRAYSGAGGLHGRIVVEEHGRQGLRVYGAARESDSEGWRGGRPPSNVAQLPVGGSEHCTPKMLWYGLTCLQNPLS